MAAETATTVDQIPDFIHELFYPAPLTSFRESMPSGELEILFHRRRGQTQKIRLINLFPFMTLKDIKLALCIELKKEIPSIPEYIYLCLHGDTPGKDGDVIPFVANATAPLDFSWNFPGISSDKPLRITDPYRLASGEAPADARFVDSGGDRKLVSPVDRERMTIEDACFKKGVSRGIPVIHAYLYTDLLEYLPGSKPPSEKEWNGRLYPMFPHLSVAAGTTPSAELLANAQRQATVFLRRQQFMVKIESVLESNVPLISLTMAGIKYLQLTWESKKNIQGIENQFYEAIVNERRPFLRLIPTEGAGLSKVYLSDGKTPDIQDPKLLVQWSQDRSPTPEQDFAFAKVMIRKGLTNVPPIYGTLRLFNDGTADMVVEPPKSLKKLEPRNDLNMLGAQIVEGLRDLPYLTQIPELGKGIFVLGLRARKEAAAIITPRILQERLPVFSGMFQEITALPGEKPLAMLRYKLVSNFAREDRIQTFLTQVINRKVLRGEGGVGDLTNLVAEEFQLDLEEARKQVSTKLRNQGEVALVVPETKEYMRQTNPGIDVAIFAQHPFYTFHLYNVNSLENLRRIVTALSILISADSETLQVGAKAVKELLTAEAYAPEPSPIEVEEAPVDVPELPVETENAEDLGGAEDMPDYLDFFAFDKDEGEMVGEDEQKQEVIAAAKTEGMARPDAPFDREASVKEAPTTQLRKELVQVQPKEELAGAAAQQEETGTSSETGIANFFLKKLKDADSRLFDYTKSNPALKRYVSQCQPTYGRQPAVLTEEKFQEVQEEYAEDNIAFQVFPLQPGEPQKLPGKVEVDYFTVLKYGSSPDRQNYYLCSKYFCTRDEILILEKDLRGTKMRRPKGAAKLPGQCPFCKGTLIKNRQHPGPNETILERVIKPPTADKRHLFIGFLKKTPHPEGFYLPCCFTEDVPINFNHNPAFEKYKEWGSRPTTAAAAALLEDDDEIRPQQTLIDYSVVLDEAATQYIVGAEKLPLDVADLGPAGEEKAAKYKDELRKQYEKGELTLATMQEKIEKYLKSKYETQIGLLPAALNDYFDQKPTGIVSRASNPQKIQPGGMGFLRVAVENRHRYQNDSFLAAVAPFYLMNSSAEMKDHLIKFVQPREFIGLNYGNLLIEFYDPTGKRPKPEELRRWADDYLQVVLHQENEEALTRAYMSYRSFVSWLESDTQKKEYRQFALLFAQLTSLRQSYTKGITFIILDIKRDGKVSVRCPPYGFNVDLMGKNDVGFILHHWSGIWEPIFFVDNRETKTRERKATLSRTLVFQYAAQEAWPPIVGRRLQEFMTQCSSSGRAVYTSQSKMNSQAMIPASLALKTLKADANIIYDGVIRDAYNHIGALVFREKTGQPGHMIALPVVDDGLLITNNALYMDWEDPSFHPAPIDVVIEFYTKHIQSRFAFYPGFVPHHIIKSQQSDEIEAVQLKNRLYVPASPPTQQTSEKYKAMKQVRSVKEMEWTKNHEICLEDGGTEMPSDKQRMSVVEFQEIFEHLRITFSNWLAAQEDGGAMRHTLEKVIYSARLPLYEKRKRMEILLSREIESWITTDFNDEDDEQSVNSSLLRVDCRVKGQEQCNGRCVWKSDEDKCMLHVPEKTELGEDTKKVSAPRVLLVRLIEELLRYGERRRQLLEGDVARLTTLEKPIVINVPGESGKQVIYPEKSAAWYELLRLEWAKEADEKPKFLEEMGQERQEPLAELDVGNKLPERLETLLNGPEVDPKTGAIRLLRAPFESLLTPLRIEPRDIGIDADTKILTDAMQFRIASLTLARIFQIDLRSDPPVLSGRIPVKTRYESPSLPVFVITEEGPGVLVRNPSAPELLQKADIPSGLQALMLKTWAEKKGVLPAQAPGVRPRTLDELRALKRAPSTQAAPTQAAKPRTIDELRALKKPLDAPGAPKALEAPEVLEPQKAPEVLEPQKAPEVLEPQKAPEVLEPQKAPEVLEPQKAPEVLEAPAPTPEATPEATSEATSEETPEETPEAPEALEALTPAPAPEALEAPVEKELTPEALVPAPAAEEETYNNNDFESINQTDEED